MIAIVALCAPAWAQQNVPNTFVGTCDQYQPTPAGGYCINTGSATYWQLFKGDATNLPPPQTCNAINVTGCGVVTVVGIEGIPIVGAPVNGDTLCYQASPGPEWVWCAP
jgi:hypothetical protein